MRLALCLALALTLSACASLTPSEKTRLRSIAIDTAGIVLKAAVTALAASLSQR